MRAASSRRSSETGVHNSPRGGMARARSGSPKPPPLPPAGVDDKKSDRSGKSNCIQVAVRARPLNAIERKENNKIIWRLKDGKVEELNEDSTPAGKSHHYDNVFGPESTNEEVYTRQCRSIVQGALEGYNGTIFAYGQTSSGKTFTLMGDLATAPGVTPQAIGDIFKWIGENPHCEWDVHIAYIEIYNETITDLLQKNKELSTNLKIVDDTVFGPTVRDLTEVRAINFQHCMDVFREGEKRRAYAATGMNAMSSRSHTIFRVRIESRAVTSNRKDEAVENMRYVAHEFMATKTEITADRGSLYLVDRETEELYIHAGEITLRFPMNQGIAGAVASSGEIINIADAYQDNRFNPTVDKKTGYRTKSILCMPIKESDGKVAGVVQFMNKQEGASFGKTDEDNVEKLCKRIAPLIQWAQSNARTCHMSRLNLVDLAGSERQKKTSASGSVLKEASHINTSLMMLGTCISLLSEGKAGHIPFRNSKLTHMLSTSLGGNTNTCLICAFSPASRNRGETISTLAFASRAKKIVNHVQQNILRDQSELVKVYEQEIEKLRAELQQAKTAVPPQQGAPSAADPGNEEEQQQSQGNGAMPCWFRDKELADMKSELTSAQEELAATKAELEETRNERDKLLARLGPVVMELEQARDMILLLSGGTRDICAKLKDAIDRERSQRRGSDITGQRGKILDLANLRQLHIGQAGSPGNRSINGYMDFDAGVDQDMPLHGDDDDN